jgi:hypothetical protein
MKKLLFQILLIGLVALFGGGCAAPIHVKDFGTYWGKGTVDPVLEGGWWLVGIGDGPKAQSSDSLVIFDKEGDHYLLTQVSSDTVDKAETWTQAKTLMLGKHKFLMLRKVDQKAEKQTTKISGDIELYSVQKECLTLYNPVLEEQTKGRPITQNKQVPETITKPSAQEERACSTSDEKALYTPVLKAKKKVRHRTKPSAQAELTFAKLDEKTVRYLTKLADDPKKWQAIAFVRIKDLQKAKEEIRRRNTTTQKTKQ